MKEQCTKEVKELHQFFEDWFKGIIENTDDVFGRFPNSLGDEFLLIAPSGEKISRSNVIERIKSEYGKFRDENIKYRLFVKNIRCRILEGNLCLVLYEEWANLDDKTISRMSSALFRRRDDAPNGVEWSHVHETYFPHD